MSHTIHGNSHKALKYMRENPAALSVYWDYIARKNVEGVAWPSVRGLAKDTGWCADECLEGRQWLIEHKALEVVEDYVRPDWRKLEPQVRARLMNFDKAVYCRPTGQFEINGQTLDMLYIGEHQEGDEDEIEERESSDVRQGLTSGVAGCQTPSDVSPHRTELDSNKEELGSIEDIVSSSEETIAPLPSDEGTAHGFELGSTVYVWSAKVKSDVPVIVAGSTPDYVLLSWSNGTLRKTFRRKPANVFREPRKLETYEDLTPLQQTVGKWTRNIKPGEGIPGNTKAFLNTVINRLEARFGTNGKATNADELDHAWSWVKGQGKIPPTDPEKIPGMVNDYRDAHQPKSASPTTPAPHKLADPKCPICFGNGVILDRSGNQAPCTCVKAVAS